MISDSVKNLLSFLLCSGRFEFIITYYYKYWRFFFTRNLTISCQASLLYYLYCLCNSIIDRLSIRLTVFLSESGCKGKNFITYLPNVFGSFFFKSSLFGFCRKAFRYHLSCERSEGPKPAEAPRLTAFRSACQPSFVSFQKTAAKVRTLSHIFQMFFELFFSESFVTVWKLSKALRQLM